MEQIQAILAADEAEARSCSGLGGRAEVRRRPFLRHLVLAAAEAYPDLPIVVHLDHGASPAACGAADPLGVHVRDDGRLAPQEDVRTPATYAYNLEVTRRVVELAHAVGVSVEGELGCIGSLETARGREGGRRRGGGDAHP